MSFRSKQSTIFVSYDDVLQIATKEELRDHSFRELRFLCLFIVTLLPFFYMQAKISDRYVTQNELKTKLETSSFPILDIDLFMFNVKYGNLSENKTAKIPSFWFPNDDKRYPDNVPIFPPSESLVKQPPQSPVISSTSTFSELNTDYMFWSWFWHVVLQGIIFPQLCQLGEKFQPVDQFWVFSDKNLTKALQAIYEQKCLSAPSYVKRYLLQGVRVRTVKTTSLPCNVVGKIINQNSVECVAGVDGQSTEDTTDLSGYFPYVETIEPTVNLSNINNQENVICRSSNTSQPSSICDENATSYKNIKDVYTYFWQQSAALNEMPITSSGINVPGNGYVVNFPIYKSSYYSLVNKVSQYMLGLSTRYKNNQIVLPCDSHNHASRFIDDKVRMIITSMAFYNPHLNTYAYVQLIIYISASKSWTKEINYYVARSPISDFSKTSDQAEYGLSIVGILYILWAFSRFIREFNIYRIWRLSIILDLIILGLYGYTMYWIFYAHILHPSDFQSFPPPEHYAYEPTDPLWVCTEEQGNCTKFAPCGGQPPNFSGKVGEYVKAYCTSQIIFASLTLSIFMKMLILLTNFGRFGVFGEHLYYARYNLFYFFVIYLFFLVMFSYAAYIFYANDISNLDTYGKSLFTFTSMLLRMNTNIDVFSQNQFSAVFSSIFLIVFFVLFLWIFASVLLAELYSSWTKVKDEYIKNDKKEKRLQNEQLRICCLYSNTSKLEPDFSIGSINQNENNIFHIIWKMVSNESYREKGKRVLLEKIFAITQSGWVSKKYVRINLIEWKRASDNGDYLDYLSLEEALIGINSLNNITYKQAKQKYHNIDEQVLYYFNLLHDKTLTKMEVEQKISVKNIGLKYQQGGNLSTNSGDLNLSTQKNISTMVDNLSKDHYLWLKQINSRLESIRIRQNIASKNNEKLDKKLEKVTIYANQ